MRRLSDCRVPVPVQPILVAEDVIPIPWDQPVDHACRAIPESEVGRLYFHDLPIKSSLLQWDREGGPSRTRGSGGISPLCRPYVIRGIGEG